MFAKILFIIFLIYDLFFISKCRYRKKIIIIISAILLYVGLFLLNVILQKDTSVFFYECQNTIRTFFFPLVLLCLYNLYLEKRFTPNCKYLQAVLIGYLLLILVPLVTHTGFNSYAYSKTGTIGWFYSTNEIGGILSILLPFLLAYLLSKKKIFSLIGIILVLYIYFSIGTKVPILALTITVCLFGIYSIFGLIQNKKWRQLSYLFISFVVGVFCIFLFLPKTSFYQNIQIHLQFLKVDSFSDLLTVEKIDHFVFSERISFFEKTMSNYQNSSSIEHLLGIGYIENYATDSMSIKMVEMDYYDVFFRHGIMGSILYFLPLLILLKQVYYKMKKRISISYFTSIILILLLSLFSGHILVAPSVSIIVSYILISYLYEEGSYENRIYNGKL